MGVEIGREGHRDPVPGGPELTFSDQQAHRFQVFYEMYYPAVYVFALRRLLGSNDDAADVTAEVFAIAWRRRDQIPSPPEDRLWIYGVARRVLSRHKRGVWRRARLLRRLGAEASVGLEAEDAPGGAAPTRDRVQAAISRLKSSDRDVLSLVLWEQLSHSEAARVLGCSVNAVALRLHKARCRLRKELALGHEPSVNFPRESNGLPAKEGFDDEP